MIILSESKTVRARASSRLFLHEQIHFIRPVSIQSHVYVVLICFLLIAGAANIRPYSCSSRPNLLKLSRPEL